MHQILLNIPDSFETASLKIRRFLPGDGEVLAQAFTETVEDLRLWINFPEGMLNAAYAEEIARRFHADFILRNSLEYAIFLKEPTRFVGHIGYHTIHWGVPKFEMGCWIRRGYQGKGYATEAAKCLVQMGILDLYAKRIEIRCAPQNTSSARIAEKLGFEFEGVLRHDFITSAGIIRNSAVYAKIVR